MPGGGRPARAARTVLIVSPTEERRRDWSKIVADDRTAVLTCPGPTSACLLIRGRASCPLVERAGVVLYDFDATSPSFIAALLRAHRDAEVVLVRDRVVSGRHRPSMVLRRMPRGSSFKAMP